MKIGIVVFERETSRWRHRKTGVVTARYDADMYLMGSKQLRSCNPVITWHIYEEFPLTRSLTCRWTASLQTTGILYYSILLDARLTSG